MTGVAVVTPVHAFDVNKCTVCGSVWSDTYSDPNCPDCSSRPRLRSMYPLVNDWVKGRVKASFLPDLPLLAFSMTGGEKEMLLPVFAKFKSVSLFGTYGSDHEAGVDMRDLSRYGDNSFSGVFGCLLFDYFEEHEAAIRECFRVTAPGGMFIQHIAPYRLVEGKVPPSLTGKIKKREGYFDYLPDQADLPSVTVGKEWFADALKTAGFDTHIVKINDSLNGTVSEWFIGIKPGGGNDNKAPAPLPPAAERKQPAAAPKGNPEAVYEASSDTVFSAVARLDEKRFVKIYFDDVSLNKPESLLYLDDLYHDSQAERIVAACDRRRDRIYASADGAATWREIGTGVEWGNMIRCCKILRGGGFIVFVDGGHVFHLDAKGALVSRHKTGNWPWHGTQGIGETSDGTVMYAEYAPLQEKEEIVLLHVWRYSIAQDKWDVVKTLQATAAPPLGEIRHFHTCRPLEYDGRTWVLSSGDITTHNRLWTSDNRGDNWSEVHVSESDVQGEIPNGYRKNIFRFTQFCVLGNGDLLWPTDDILGQNRSALVQLSLKQGEASCRIVKWLGTNCMRNISQYGDDTFVLISESKHDADNCDLFVINTKTGYENKFLLPNFNRKKCPVTASLGSGILHDGYGFYHTHGNILTHQNRGLIRIRIEELQ